MKFKCFVCGKLTSGRKPKGGDGSFYYPRRHRLKDGRLCEGVFMEAVWIKESPNNYIQPTKEPRG